MIIYYRNLVSLDYGEKGHYMTVVILLLFSYVSRQHSLKYICSFVQGETGLWGRKFQLLRKQYFRTSSSVLYVTPSDFILRVQIICGSVCTATF